MKFGVRPGEQDWTPGFIDPWRVVYQPDPSNLCGAACVATVLRTTLDEACKLIGKRGLTGARDLRQALAKRGVTMGPRLSPKDNPDEALVLCRVHWPPVGVRRTHWVLMDRNGDIIDPSWGFNPPWKPGTRITSVYVLTGVPE